MLQSKLAVELNQPCNLMLSSDGLTRLDYVIHEDINIQRIRLFYRLDNPHYDQGLLLTYMLHALQQHPTLDLPHQSYTSCQNLRLPRPQIPNNCLEQSFLVILTSATTPAEQQVLNLVANFYPIHFVYQCFVLELHPSFLFPNEVILAEDFSLSFKEQVETYYFIAHNFIPSVAHYLPTFNDFAINTERYCHIVQRHANKLTGIMWLESTFDSIMIRLLFSLKDGYHVLEPLLHKALCYARQRGKKRIELFCDINTSHTLRQRYLNQGFQPTEHYLHYFCFR